MMKFLLVLLVAAAIIGSLESRPMRGHKHKRHHKHHLDAEITGDKDAEHEKAEEEHSNPEARTPADPKKDAKIDPAKDKKDAKKADPKKADAKKADAKKGAKGKKGGELDLGSGDEGGSG